MKKLYSFISITLVLLLMITMIGPMVTMAEEVAVDLKTADNFAILAGSTITNTGTTMINGDVGLHPGTVFSGQETINLNGELHLTDAVALQAKNDLVAAFNNLAGRTVNTTSSELGGSTLTPGVYSSATSFQITGTLTLDGANNSDAVFIFQTGSALTTASASKIVLINGAKYENVFWQVGSSATLGTNSEFSGSILSSESITARTGAKIDGKLLAMGGAVTLDSNVLNSPESNSLTVSKIVTGDTTGLTLPLFEITVTGPGNFSETKAFIHNESFTWDGLVPGEYIVTENASILNEDWTISGEGSVEVMADQEHFVTITNAYDEGLGIDPADQFNGSLIIGKIVTGNIEDMTLPSFEITVTGPDNYTDTRNILNNETYTLENLEPGLYQVTENPTTLNDDWTISGEGAIEVVADEVAMVTVTNNFEGLDLNPTDQFNGSLIIGKIVTGNIEDMTLPSFEITVTGPDNYTDTRNILNNDTYTLENLEPGLYQVTENPTSLNDDWTISGEGEIEVLADEVATVTITNDYDADIIEDIPQTGQSTQYTTAIIIGIIALIFAGTGFILSHRRKRFDA